MKHSKVRDVMTTDVVSITVDTSFKDIVRTLATRHVSGLPVLDHDGVVVGVVSEVDLLHKDARRPSHAWAMPFAYRRARAKAAGRVAGDLLTASVMTVDADASVVEAARLLVRHGIKRLPVVDGAGHLVGIVSAQDLLRVFLRSDADLEEEIVHDVFEHTLGITVTPATVCVEVHEGVVTLHGELERKSQIPVAVSLTGYVDGVVGVDSELAFAYDDTHLASGDQLNVDIPGERWHNR